MTLHVPTHHHRLVDTDAFRDMLKAVTVGAVVLVAMILATQINVAVLPVERLAMERDALLDFRAAEVADWNAGVTTQAQSILEFRAAERDLR